MPAAEHASTDVRSEEPSFRAGEGFADTTADQPLVAPEPKPFVMDAETREAYADDAIRCLTGIEQAILSFEQNPSDHRTIQSICRELHTLKGASATVGLDEFATYFHQVEDSLTNGRDVGVDVVLACVDAVREQLKLLVDEATREADVPEVRSYNVEDTGDATPDSIRVKSSQLDRLLDLLAELVMLRNRRDSRVDSLRQVNDELVRCVTRLRTYGENVTSEMIANSGDQNNFARTAAGINSLTEVATDLLELGQNLRELYEPVAEENAALSRFIGQFRQELMELRRMPINGLFQRVQRTLREAARVENKQVRMEVRGQHLGLERSVQEQLFDPLLHIVRNAVSHGIELPKDRESVGKSPTGTLTLSASASSNLFVLEIRDDGRGLDYDALRRRGQERGLLPSNRPATHEELSRLIFHPGFSTRSSVNEISGRGVGMDVVAATLERLQGWVDVTSALGKGPWCAFKFRDSRSLNMPWYSE
ncbi:MAG: ATP-binding protein [Pirellulaceae bacterium]